MPFVAASGVNVNFPFEPYECQEAYMSKVIDCLRNGYHGILESPTGTGKTLCLLCSSLAWLEDKKAQISSQRWKLAGSEPGVDALDFYKHQLANQLDEAAGSWSGELAPPKIIYASRTHTQLTQAVQELKRTAYRHFKVAVLGSREQMCIHPHVMREESNSAKVHLCRAKVSARTCHFFNNLETAKGNFTNQVLDIEDLVKLGQKHNCCPYYVAKELKTEADIVFMPYNYLLDPKSRKANGVELQGNIIIFDEAHNLEKICEDSASFDLKSSDIAAAIRELQEVSEKLLEWVRQEEQGGDMADSQTGLSGDFNLREVYELKAMLHDLEKQIDSVELSSKQGITKEGRFMFDLLRKANLTFESKNHVAELIDKIITHLTGEGTSSFHSRGAGLTKIADIIKIVFSREPDEFSSSNHHMTVLSKAYKVHIQDADQSNKKKKKLDSWGSAASSNKPERTLSYWCFSPGHAMNDLLSAGVKSIILTSGTLSPMSSFKTEMGMVGCDEPEIVYYVSRQLFI